MSASEQIALPPRPMRGNASYDELTLDGRVEGALQDAARYLAGQQAEDGHWCAELEGDTILESEFILTLMFLGRGHEPRVHKAAEYIRQKQIPSGGWANYPGGGADVSASVKAYFVLKILGDDPHAPHMVRARRAILDVGGIEACNSYTKIYLAIFGQYRWDRCPAIPPELILFPRWFPFNIYRMSSWSRAIVVPLSMVWAQRPHCPVPEHASIRELFTHRLDGPVDVTKYTGRRTLWTTFFGAADQALKFLERLPWKPLRRCALDRCETWIRDRLQMSDGVGGIIPPIINTIMGFSAMGFSEDDPLLAGQIRELEKLQIEDEDTLRVQPCFSPVWDTAQVLNALLESGTSPADPLVLEGTRWLLNHEVRHAGDWCVKVKGVEPGGWYFEYANEFYPDCDDTAEVLLVLAKVRFPSAQEDARRRRAITRGLNWLLAMQNDDGGWAAFDRDCNSEYLTHVPFADHNAMLDPSCEDITARVLEALKELGFARDHVAIRRAVAYLRRTQQEDGAWYGRWGVNYIYGTWLVLWGLNAVGEDMSRDGSARGAAWLLARQNDDGGWGELPNSYDDPSSRGQGPSTAAQTAWAILGLLATGHRNSDAVRRGLDFLLERQEEDGTWHDESWTGTGFPRVFYLRYHYYATQFPLLAMALWHAAGSRAA